MRSTSRAPSPSTQTSASDSTPTPSTEKRSSDGTPTPSTEKRASDGTPTPSTEKRASDGTPTPSTEKRASDGTPTPSTEKRASDGRRDTFLWLGLSALIAVEYAIYSAAGGNGWPVFPRVELFALVIGGGVAVVLGRSRPVGSLIVAAMLQLLPVIRLTTEHGEPPGVVYPVTPWLVLVVLSYLAGRRMDSAHHAAVAAAITTTAGFPIAVSLAGFEQGFLMWCGMVGFLLCASVLPWLLGQYRRQRLALVATGWRRAEQLEREHRSAAERARLRERARIAQDMHDSLGHELSLIAVRAAALEIDPQLGSSVQHSAGELRMAAGAATTRLQEIIGVLREDGERAPTSPAEEEVAVLVDRAIASGMTVELRERGTVTPPPRIRLALHRIVQESLTNAAKHAPGSSVLVDVESTARTTTVTVVNGAASEIPAPTSGGGAGLTGLGERASLLGGILRAGPTGDGGFAVRAELPHDGAAAEVAAEPAPGSESAAELARARRRVRRGLVALLGIPAALGAGLGAVMLGYYLYATANSVLEPSAYAGLVVGQSLADIDDVLPAVEMVDPPTRHAPPAPDSAECRFYRSNGVPFDGRFDSYRLCFADGRLVAKDVVPTGEQPGTDPSDPPAQAPPDPGSSAGVLR